MLVNIGTNPGITRVHTGFPLHEHGPSSHRHIILSLQQEKSVINKAEVFQRELKIQLFRSKKRLLQLLKDCPAVIIKALTALVGHLSLTVGWENGPGQEFKTVSSNF